MTSGLGGPWCAVGGSSDARSRLGLAVLLAGMVLGTPAGCHIRAQGRAGAAGGALGRRPPPPQALKARYIGSRSSGSWLATPTTKRNRPCACVRAWNSLHMSRPYRAPFLGMPCTQGFTLGWYIAPLRGLAAVHFVVRWLNSWWGTALRAFAGQLGRWCIAGIDRMSNNGYCPK